MDGLFFCVLSLTKEMSIWQHFTLKIFQAKVSL